MIQHNKAIDLVYNIIVEEASEAHPINQNEILAKLQDNPDDVCDRRTVSRALDRLKEKYGMTENGEWIDDHIHLHYTTVMRSSSPIYKNYWFEFCYEDEDDFTDEELMFLMDAVQFSKHIDPSNAKEVISKLAKLSHNRFSGVFEFYTNINEKNVPVRKDIFLIIGDINRAIRMHQMISFYDNRFGIDKKLHPVSDTPVEVCPFRIVVSDGYYFLLYSAKDSDVIKSCRIDRITDVTILDKTVVHTIARRNAALHPNEYLIEHRYMNTGDTVKVTLEIDRSILGDVIDAFGTKITIDPAGDSANRLTVHVKSSERDIIDWAMRYGEYAVLIDPDYLRNEIIERSERISRYYRDDNRDIRYCEQIELAEQRHRLMLIDIDLNGQETYKHLNGIERLTLRHNGIRDFSFLQSYTDLRELVISHNGIGTPEVISRLSSLRMLTLDMTGIAGLDFLLGLDNLNRLTIHEYSLENVEAIYSLPNLRYLAVSKPVSRLIDKKRLKNNVKFIVEDRFYMPHFMRPTLPPEDPTQRPSNRLLEAMSTFSTSKVTDSFVREALCSKIYSGSRRFCGPDKKFILVDECCGIDERTTMYKDLMQYAGSEYTWFVTYKGTPVESASDLYLKNIAAISFFKKDHGLKLVGMARNFEVIRSPAGLAHIKYLMDNNIGWAEISGELERDFATVCTMQNVINPTILEENNVFPDIEIDADDYHYYRPDDSGKKNVKKIAYGHIELD